MYLVDSDYKEAIYAPIRATRLRVTFDVSDVTADEDLNSIVTTPEFYLSDKQQLMDKTRELSYKIATWEKDRFKLDGSFTFADEDKTKHIEMGYCSNELCDANGVFTSYPTITFNYNNPHSTIGLTITFDALLEEYAKDFSVVAYNSNNEIVGTVDVVNNEKSQIIPIGQLYQYTKIQIVIKKWSKPFRRARVMEVDFGIIKVYDGSNLIKASMIEELDLISSTLPSAEFKFTVDNVNKEFNMLNPDGFYKYLQQRQQVLAEIGVDINGSFKYIPVGEYFLWDWKSEEGSLTASFTAKTIIEMMESFEYENLVPKENYNLYQMVEGIFNYCEITKYNIDSALMGIPTLGLVEKTNCKEILQLIAIASCSNIFVSKNGYITIKVSPNVLGIEVDNISMDNMYTTPQIELENVIKSVEVNYFTDIDSETIIKVTDDNIQKGDTLKIDSNTLINTSDRANIVANWILTQSKYRAKYTTNWRQNPALEVNDIVTIENSYGQAMKAIITKQDWNFEGYLSGKTEAKGLINIVD